MSGTTPFDSFPKPTTITGGCLCGSIRYQVDFPEDHNFLKSVSKNPAASSKQYVHSGRVSTLNKLLDQPFN